MGVDFIKSWVTVMVMYVIFCRDESLCCGFNIFRTKNQNRFSIFFSERVLRHPQLKLKSLPSNETWNMKQKQGATKDKRLLLLNRLGPLQTANSYQVQMQTGHRKREKRMLIGISIRSVTSKRSCALDGSPSPSCKRVESKRWKMKATGKNIWNFRFGGHRDLVRSLSLNNVF